jgi:hypothetical protein
VSPFFFCFLREKCVGYSGSFIVDLHAISGDRPMQTRPARLSLFPAPPATPYSRRPVPRPRPCDATCLHGRPSLERRCWAAAGNVASTSERPFVLTQRRDHLMMHVRVNSLIQQYVSSFLLLLLSRLQFGLGFKRGLRAIY